MTILQPVQPCSPTFFKNLKGLVMSSYRKVSGEAGCSGCKIDRYTVYTNVSCDAGEQEERTEQPRASTDKACA